MPLEVGEIPDPREIARYAHQQAEFPAPVSWSPLTEELRRESLLVPLRQRSRDVRQGPDELLYLLTDENEGAVLRASSASIVSAGTR